MTPKYTRHTILTPDGGTISLDWWHASHQSKLRASTPVLLCLHAFAGRPILDASLSFPCVVTAGLLTCSALPSVAVSADRLNCNAWVQCMSATISNAVAAVCVYFADGVPFAVPSKKYDPPAC